MEKSDDHISLSLETVMKTSVLKTMSNPSWPIVYGTIAWKLGCFYERYWSNETHGLKRNTEKAAEMTKMIDNMKSISPTEKGIAVMACYAREIKKFEKDEYENWKKFIWMDLGEEAGEMEAYVDAVTPPDKLPGETSEQYKKREKSQFEEAYDHMRDGVILVEILNKIWTLRKAKTETDESYNKTKNKTSEMLKILEEKIEGIHDEMKGSLGAKEWNEIAELW